MDLWLPPKPAIIRPAPDDARRDWTRPHTKKAVREANFAPGWFPAGALGATPLTVSQVASTSSGGTVGVPLTVTCPSVDAGDLIILYNGVNNNQNITPSTVSPSGFTSISNISRADTRCICWYKVATGSEDGSTFTGMTPDTVELSRGSMILVVFRGSRPVTSVVVADVEGECTATNPSPQTISASAGTTPLIVIATFFGSGTIGSPSFSPSPDNSVVSSGSRGGLYWKIYNTDPQDVSVDMADQGSNGMQSFYVTCVG